MRILHIEVGGSYGGSLRALENYLSWSDRTRLKHDFLLYYSTPGAERLKPLVNDFRVRFSNVRFAANPTDKQGSLDRCRYHLRKTWIGPYVSEALLWTRVACVYPRALRLGDDLRARELDLVHINNTFPYNVEALIAARHAGIPVAGHARNPIEANLFNKWALRLTSGVATVNQRLQRQLSAWAPKLPVQTCYDGVMLNPVAQESVKKLRSSLPKSATYLICSAGRLDQQKGYEYLVEAARLVLDARLDVMFAIAGDGPLRARIENKIAELGMVDRFQLLGFRQDIQNVIAASDLFISSSLWEGLPIVAVESIMLAKPLVLTDVGGSSEVVSQGGNGYVVPAADAQALAKAILTALDNVPALSNGSKEVGSSLIAPMEVQTSARVLDEFFERLAKSR